MIRNFGVIKGIQRQPLGLDVGEPSSSSITAGDNVYFRPIAFSSNSNATPVEGATATMARAGTVRIAFDLVCNPYGTPTRTAKAQIFKNGVATGTLRSTQTLVTYTQDFACNESDVFTIKAYLDNTSPDEYARVSNVKISGLDKPFVIV